MYTPLQISMKLKVHIGQVLSHIRHGKIDPIKTVYTTKYYHLDMFYDLSTRKHLNIKRAKEKLLIIDYWIAMKLQKSNLEISLELGITESRMLRILKELEENQGFVIIKSRLC